MTTEAQVLANRSNATRSTGPRTKTGKAIVAQNAIKHGLLAHQDVIAEEDPQQYEDHRQRLLGELSPGSEMETLLAGRIVSLTWRLQRAERLQNELFDYLLGKEIENTFANLPDPMPAVAQERLRTSVELDPAYAVGRMLAKDYRGEKTLDRLTMHERRIEGSLYRTMNEWRRLQLAPKKEGVHGTPYESACSVPVRASFEETPYGVTTNEGDCAKQSQSQEVPNLKCEVSSSTPAPGGDPSRGRLGHMVDDPACETKPMDSGGTACSAPARASEEPPCGVTTNAACPAKQSQCPGSAARAVAVPRALRRVACHYHNVGRSC
jgi:hypothetical protein